MTERIPQGLITAVITPLCKDSPQSEVPASPCLALPRRQAGGRQAAGGQSPKSELDVESFRKLLTEVKKTAVLINGTAEGMLLRRDIRKKVIETAMEVMNGETGLIIGITGDTAERTLDNIKMVEDCRKGLNYIGEIFLFDCPLWYHSNRGLPAYYEKLAEVTSLPIILSNNPGVILNLRKTLKRHNIRTNVFKKLSYNERIVGLEHSGDLHRFLNYIRAGRHRPEFGFYDGNELNFLNNPSSSGVISIGANILYRHWKEVVNSSLLPDDSRKEDADYCKLLWQKRETIKKLILCYKTNPAALVKAGLKYTGLINSDAVAEGLKGANSEEKVKICDLLENLISI